MQEISFWELISSSNINRICIPTIQRDYAQGRKDKVFVRCNFLKALKLALDSDKELTLDFVYGIDNDIMFIPLDGQQRLTTLWLLHWYIAYKANILNDDKIKSVLLKFSYETRHSSSDFCKSLCSLAPILGKKSLRKWITEQTWYYHHYKQDPTIIGMLNMISEVTPIDNKGKDIPNSLQQIFIDKECDYLRLWEKLTKTHIIKFNKLKVGLNDSDELYVKMNARGKQLTDFENFKTELVQHVKKNKILEESDALEFAANLDVKWTDIFWKNKWEDNKTEDISIDEIYFSFIRRFVSLESIRKDQESKEDTLIGKFSRVFTNFEPYQNVLDQDTIENFTTIMNRLSDISKIELNTLSPWGKSPWDNFDFIPKYKGENKKDENKKDITAITATQRLLFYGYCQYFIYGCYDENSFGEWNRVLWNICENRVDSKLRPTMGLIDEIAEYSHNILQYLSESKDIDFEQNKEQMKEEQCKARHLSEYPEIREMEGYSFFKGAIRFLYTDSEKKENWEDFRVKCENVKKLIPSHQRHTIKEFTPYIAEDALSTIYFHWVSNTDDDLRTIFLNNKAIPYLHNFLLQNEMTHESLLHRDIIELCETAFNRGYLSTYWKNDSKYIWTNYSRAQGYYQDNSYIIGNELFSRVSNIIDSSKSQMFEISKDQKEKRQGKHIQGLYLNFKFGGQYFKLYGNNTICLMKDNWDDKYPYPKDSKGLYFNIDEIETEKDLIDNLNSLIKKLSLN